ncbi:type VI secretion system-associated FHA domain protein TagH, partial [Vibrio diabolicus]
NGTFVNNAVTPVGQGNEIALSDDDTVSLGDYQISVSIQTSTEAFHNQESNFRSSSEPEAFSSSSEAEFVDLGLSASELLNESVPSDFQLDIGLVDDFIDIPKPEKQSVDPTPVPETPRQLERQSTPKFDSNGSELAAFIKGAGIDPTMIP